MSMPLPIVALRLPDEGLGSWIHRTARIYELTPHHLLDDWSGQRRCMWHLTTESRVAETRLACEVANKMRAPETRSPEMNPWIVRSTRDVAICPYCLIGDDVAHRPRYLRTDWSYAWCVTCPYHPTKPLMGLRDWESANLLAFKHSAMRTAAGTLLRCQKRRNLPTRYTRRRPSISSALLALRQLEKGIRSALAGRAPRSSTWGKLTATEFLKIVDDTTTFALSRFDHSAPLAADPGIRFVDRSSIQCFGRSSAYLASGLATEIRALSDAGDVGWRRRGLFVAYELMNARTTRSWLPHQQRVSRSRRLASFLGTHNSTALTWLSMKMRGWPASYCDDWWKGSQFVSLQ